MHAGFPWAESKRSSSFVYDEIANQIALVY